MSQPADQTQQYTRTLTRIAGSLAVAHCADVENDVADGFSVEQVKMFTDGNLDKRFLKLQDQVEMLAEERDDLDDLIVDYVRTIPLAAYDTGRSDGDRFTRWLADSHELTAEQRDIITVIRSRVAVEERARLNRLAHVRFQELASLNDELIGDLQTNRSLMLHVNPIRIQASFESARLLGDEPPEPGCEILFYAWQNEVRTCVLEPESAVMLRVLSDGEPCLLESLQRRLELMGDVEVDQLYELIADCSEVGLIAFS